ncbi:MULTISPECIES: hypothetical protein [Photobacterium]|uniref:hypothetical protein n=1 Tax=Photobacterium TaxID=657 RepID=UPI000695DA97|nr:MULTISPECIES: hypothetical protein [Photobacterium]UIP29228.1 hypothetical protein LN341_07135 [Photobacterium sp. TLY01]
MRSSSPFPGQNDKIFRDKFCKWPKLMRYLVFISLLPPAFLVTLLHADAVSFDEILIPGMMASALNILLFFWGIILKVKARKHWYRNYHIGKTMFIALLPVIASSYMFLEQHEPNTAANHLAPRSVQLSVN